MEFASLAADRVCAACNRFDHADRSCADVDLAMGEPVRIRNKNRIGQSFGAGKIGRSTLTLLRGIKFRSRALRSVGFSDGIVTS